MCLCAEFKAMMLLFENEETILDFENWITEKAYEFLMFHYWRMILDPKVLSLIILHFVRSERERNFNFMLS